MDSGDDMEPEPKRRISPVKVAVTLTVVYLLIARWKGLHPGGPARVVGTGVDLAWPLHLSG
jgi:hypothetical protein